MSSLISSTELASFVSGIRDHFETFASMHTLIIIKEPLKQIVNIENNEYYGYGQPSAPENYILTPQSGVFNCMTYDQNTWEDENFDPVPISLAKGDAYIKVEELAKNYIDNQKTELVVLDNLEYNIVGGPLPKNYGTQNYYYYSLNRTT